MSYLDTRLYTDVVWPETKQIGLIDSIFRNYYIPPVIFSVNTSDDGTESRVCIDGKQRLTSIQKFMDGLIPHRDSVTGKRLWFKQAGSVKRACLPKSVQQAFTNKQIVCVEYDRITDDQEREIFQRVQLGVALTPAERMAAITGPWPSFIREIQSEVLGEEGFGSALDWGRTRGRDFQGLVAIVFMIDKLPTFTTPVSPALDKWLQRTIAVPQKLRQDVLDTFRTFVTLVRDKRYNSAFHKPIRVSPIEFVMIGVLIHEYRTELSFTQLSSAIEMMRGDVRKKEKDVRTNTRVTKSLFQFIRNKVKPAGLKSDGKGDKPASFALAESGSKSTLKRKRNSDSGDESLPARAKPKVSTSKATSRRPAKSPATRAPAATTSSVTLTPKVSSAKISKTSQTAKSSPVISAPSSSSPVIPPQQPSAGAIPNGTKSTPVLPPVNTNVPPVSSSSAVLASARPSSPASESGQRGHSGVSASSALTPSQSNKSASQQALASPTIVKAEQDAEPKPSGSISGRLAAIRAAKTAAINSPRNSPLASIQQTPSPAIPQAPMPTQPLMPPPAPPAPSPVRVKPEQIPASIPPPATSQIDMATVEAILAAAGIGPVAAPLPPAFGQGAGPNETPIQSENMQNGGAHRSLSFSFPNPQSGQRSGQAPVPPQASSTNSLPSKPVIDPRLARTASTPIMDPMKAAPLAPQHSYPPPYAKGPSSVDGLQRPPHSASSVSSISDHRHSWQARSPSRERGRGYDRGRGYGRGRGYDYRGRSRDFSRGGHRYDRRDRDRDWFEDRHRAHKGWDRGPENEPGGSRSSEGDWSGGRRRSQSRWDRGRDKERERDANGERGTEWEKGQSRDGGWGGMKREAVDDGLSLSEKTPV
ncbi:hypothetical protein EW146_g4643 [Bondarzewia mesenterica]|uniref:GmrSD restriction endonucleases N-terminal domain-containing protein n=1 Tax=Bondarzewia mesenterica TaxID=1095465 RepID=A0A4S4LTW5_9AGAM|nr:hypothetical protein EW146_g4643 [Bondarzewia mesenterica]